MFRHLQTSAMVVSAATQSPGQVENKAWAAVPNLGTIGAAATGLHHSSEQHQILNPLNEARDRNCNLMVPSWICFCCSRTGNHISILDIKKLRDKEVISACLRSWSW